MINKIKPICLFVLRSQGQLPVTTGSVADWMSMNQARDTTLFWKIKGDFSFLKYSKLDRCKSMAALSGD